MMIRKNHAATQHGRKKPPPLSGNRISLTDTPFFSAFTVAFIMTHLSKRCNLKSATPATNHDHLYAVRDLFSSRMHTLSHSRQVISVCSLFAMLRQRINCVRQMPFLSRWIHIKYDQHALHGMSATAFDRSDMWCQAYRAVTALAAAALVYRFHKSEDP